MNEKPKGPWFDKQLAGTSLTEWTGLALMIIGASSAIGASELAQKHGLAWHLLAWLVYLPLFLLGCVHSVWAARRERSRPENCE